MIETTRTNRITGDRSSPPVTVARRFGSLASDMIELAELQFELFKADMAESTRRLILPAVLVLLGIAAVLAAFPVALIALGYLLVELAEFPHSAAMVIAAVSGLIIGAGLLLGAYRLFSRVSDTFKHSQTEFTRNVNWIKSTLRSGE